MTDLVTGEAVALDIRVARLGSRVLARLVDLAVQLVPIVAAALLLAAAGGVLDGAVDQAITLTLIVLITVGYPAIWETLTRGRSPGKMALGLRVVADDGGPVRFRQALLRALAGFVELWLLAGLPALVVSLVSERAQRLGDVFAGTIVVQERIPVRGGAAAVMPPRLAAWASGLELSRLPDDLALSARSLLARWAELTPAARDDLARRVAAGVAAHVSPPPPPGVSADEYLSAVLAERRLREEARLRGGGPVGPGTPAPPTDAGPAGIPGRGPVPPVSPPLPPPPAPPARQPYAPSAAPPRPAPPPQAPPAPSGGFAPPA